MKEEKLEIPIKSKLKKKKVAAHISFKVTEGY